METLTQIAHWLGIGILAYAIGGIPTAYLLARYILGRDIRRIGDQNSGAANVFREVGPRAGLACGIIDILKGALAVLTARLIIQDPNIEMFAGICALIGHNWPIYLGFRGGRGAAVAVGILIATLPLITLPTGALCLLALYHTRKAIIPLAIFLIAIPILAWPAGYPPQTALYALTIPLLTGLSHLYSTKIQPSLPKNSQLTPHRSENGEKNPKKSPPPEGEG